MGKLQYGWPCNCPKDRLHPEQHAQCYRCYALRPPGWKLPPGAGQGGGSTGKGQGKGRKGTGSGSGLPPQAPDQRRPWHQAGQPSLPAPPAIDKLAEAKSALALLVQAGEKGVDVADKVADQRKLITELQKAKSAGKPLSQRIASIDGAIQGRERSIKQKSEVVEAKRNEVAVLQAAIASVQTEVKALEAELQGLREKRNVLLLEAPVASDDAGMDTLFKSFEAALDPELFAAVSGPFQQFLSCLSAAKREQAARAAASAAGEAGRRTDGWDEEDEEYDDDGRGGMPVDDDLGDAWADGDAAGRGGKRQADAHGSLGDAELQGLREALLKDGVDGGHAQEWLERTSKRFRAGPRSGAAPAATAAAGPAAGQQSG